MKLKRFIAYLIDILIVGFIASALSSVKVLNPYYDNYLEAYEIFNTTIESVTNENMKDTLLSTSFISEYQDVLKLSIYSTTISLICYLLYFVGFQKWNKDQTIGKKLMNIKLVGNVSIGAYLIRTLIIYNLIFNTLNVYLAFIFSGKLFFTLSLITSIIGYIVTYTCYFMILFRKDNKGLHDIITKTSVMEVENVANKG